MLHTHQLSTKNSLVDKLNKEINSITTSNPQKRKLDSREHAFSPSIINPEFPIVETDKILVEFFCNTSIYPTHRQVDDLRRQIKKHFNVLVANFQNTHIKSKPEIFAWFTCERKTYNVDTFRKTALRYGLVLTEKAEARIDEQLKSGKSIKNKVNKRLAKYRCASTKFQDAWNAQFQNSAETPKTTIVSVENLIQPATEELVNFDHYVDVDFLDDILAEDGMTEPCNSADSGLLKLCESASRIVEETSLAEHNEILKEIFYKKVGISSKTKSTAIGKSKETVTLSEIYDVTPPPTPPVHLYHDYSEIIQVRETNSCYNPNEGPPKRKITDKLISSVNIVENRAYVLKQEQVLRSLLSSKE